MRFFVCKQIRFFPNELWVQLEGIEVVPPEFKSNGCSFSPDYIKHYDLWPACHIHDWDYTVGGTWADRRESDQRFRRNLALLLKIQNATRTLVWLLPYLYWGRVRIWGAKPYAFREDEEPASLWQRIVEGWGWFKDKR